MTESTFMRHLLRSRNDPDLIQRTNVRTQTAVNAEHSTVDNGGEVKVVEHLTAALPDVGIAVFALALVVEAIDLGDLSRLVVSSEQCDSGWMSRLERHEERECF